MLKEIYERWRRRSVDGLQPIAEMLYPPLLIKEPSDWQESRQRVMYIGQETMGWGTGDELPQDGASTEEPSGVASLKDFLMEKDSVEQLQHVYQDFDFAKPYPKNYRSPFWRYFWRVKETVETRGGSTSMVFSNVIRCAVKSEEGFTLWSLSDDEVNSYLSWQHGLIKVEIEELKPTLIIFVSGPRYDRYLQTELEDLTMVPVTGFDERALSEMKSPSLAVPTFRTYHPGYLNRSIGFAPLDAAVKAAIF